MKVFKTSPFLTLVGSWCLTTTDAIPSWCRAGSWKPHLPRLAHTPFPRDWGQGHQLSDRSNTQTNRLQASWLFNHYLTGLLFIVHHSDDQPASPFHWWWWREKCQGHQLLCHQAVLACCWCNRAPPQARATFTRALPAPAPPPHPPNPPKPLSAQCPNSLSFFFLQNLSPSIE